MDSQLSTRLTIGLLRETVSGESRVALLPSDVKKLSSACVIVVEHGAGKKAGFNDEDYQEAGAVVTDRQGVTSSASLFVKIQPPEPTMVFPSGSTLISLGGRDLALAERLSTASVTHLGLERMPRTTRAQSMDVLSSQASVVGYAAVLEGARLMETLLPMMTTAAGVVKPAKMIALGAGVAGLQAIATARRLGAVVHGFDVREAAREQVESLGAKFVFPSVDATVEQADNGYAREQSDHDQSRLRRALAEHLVGMNLIVTSAQIPGRAAPLLIDDETIAALDPGTVIVDLAAETGGNVSATRPNEVVDVGGVLITGPTNLASMAAKSASQMFGGNVRALLEHLIDNSGAIRLDRDDPIIIALLGGQIPDPSAIAAQ